MSMTKPNPGSAEAVANGCTCPVIDNRGGKGVPAGKDRAPLFWHNISCPVHGDAQLTVALSSSAEGVGE